MRIGFSVEGSTDRAVLTGLQARWCQHVELVEGRFRGRSGLSQWREISKICTELAEKRAQVIIFLRDSNDEDWRHGLQKASNRCDSIHQHLAVFGVCDRNIECWLSAAPSWIAGRYGRAESDFRVRDPKRVVESALGITRFDKKEEEIAALVAAVPLRQWLSNRSFEEFYERLRDRSQQLGCVLENLRE